MGMQAYVLTNGQLGRRLHRTNCKRIANFISQIDESTEDADKVIAEASPATCCRPNRDGLRQLANLAKNRRIRAEHEQAEGFIAEARGKVTSGHLRLLEPAPDRRKYMRNDPRFREAMAKRDALGGKRGRGTRISDTELAFWIAKVRANNPNTTKVIEVNYLYWVEGVAITRKRFYAAWDAAEAEASA